jgi:hypothetical protein
MFVMTVPSMDLQGQLCFGNRRNAGEGNLQLIALSQELADGIKI